MTEDIWAKSVGEDNQQHSIECVVPGTGKKAEPKVEPMKKFMLADDLQDLFSSEGVVTDISALKDWVVTQLEPADKKNPEAPEHTAAAVAAEAAAGAATAAVVAAAAVVVVVVAGAKGAVVPFVMMAIVAGPAVVAAPAVRGAGGTDDGDDNDDDDASGFWLTCIALHVLNHDVDGGGGDRF
jgi:hypothetical protein